ncbi:Alpha/Beta hydrolase protein [Xylaria sp. CBS 124048]|nr:Alpha/Beta hydrolase protein [Xylaria sp. CBS 124048]
MSHRETPIVQRIGFTRLSSDSSQGIPPQVNIILVHGLRGHPQATWEYRQSELNTRLAEKLRKRDRLKAIWRHQHTVSIRTSVSEEDITEDWEPSSTERVFWPREYLLEDMSEAEVWTYGYNADVIGGLFQANNRNSISQHGQDLAVKLERVIDNQLPIIFVAHSLGGIVVKDAIRRSEYCQSHTKLIVFLGTPHRGSASAGWGVVASNFAKLALQDSNKRIVQTLAPNSEVLDNIHDEFLKIVVRGRIKIHSFQEAKAVSGITGLDGKVVDDYSSKVGLPPYETVESIDGNHMEMARCKDKTDPRYQAIVGVLKHFFRSSILSSGHVKAQGPGLATQKESLGGISFDRTGVGRGS